MDSAMIRTKLHDYIERADDKHLEAIYILLEKETDSNNYDEDTLIMVNERRETYLKGNSRTYSAQESIDLIRNGKR